jgi:predicted RecA/RadA family phage recombinase
MAKNMVQQGKTLTFSPLAANVNSGDPILLNAAFGIAQTDGVTGGAVEADVEGVWSLPKTAGQAIAMGARVYFVAGTGAISTTASGNTLVGYAARAALAGDARVDVRLVPQA